MMWPNIPFKSVAAALVCILIYSSAQDQGPKERTQGEEQLQPMSEGPDESAQGEEQSQPMSEGPDESAQGEEQSQPMSEGPEESTQDKGQLETMSGKNLPWTHHEPVNNGIPTKTMFWDRIVYILLNKKDSPDGCVPITTGVILDHNRVLTSFNPFRQLSRNLSIIDDIIVQVHTGRNRQRIESNNTIKTMCTYQYYNVWSGRQVTFTPDEDIPMSAWHGRGNQRHSPLHDLMVLRVIPNFNDSFTFCNITEDTYTLEDYAPLDGPMNKIIYVFTMLIGKPGDHLEYPLRYAQLNLNQERELQFYNDIQITDRFIVNCQNHIPINWGHFICASNTRKLKGVASGAMLVSKSTLIGVGSFAYKREGASDILVFTDVRPYHDLIMHAMTDEDTA